MKYCDMIKAYGKNEWFDRFHTPQTPILSILNSFFQCIDYIISANHSKVSHFFLA